MSTSKDASTSRPSEGSSRRRVLRSTNVIGLSQSSAQTVDDYQDAFFENVKSLNLEKTDETLLAKWFRDGLREDIKAHIPRTTTNTTMEAVLGEAYLVETRVETIPPEESVDKFMVHCEDEADDYEEEEEEPEEDPEEEQAADPVEDQVGDPVDLEEEDDDFLLHGDYNPDPRYWVYDDLDQWGFGTPPH